MRETMPRPFHRLFEGAFWCVAAVGVLTWLGVEAAVVFTAFVLGATRADVYHRPHPEAPDATE